MTSTTDDRWFFDTNVLVYLFDPNAIEKQATAGYLWERACREAVPVVSTQVLQEFFVTVTKAAKQGLPVVAARDAIVAFSNAADVITVSIPLIEAATRRLEASGFSFWDSLIIESAIEAGARRLWTEDLQHGQTFGDLEVCSPFATAS